jgi:hypothetical protein
VEAHLPFLAARLGGGGSAVRYTVGEVTFIHSAMSSATRTGPCANPHTAPHSKLNERWRAGSL